MKEYKSPSIQFVEFGEKKLNTASSRCNCYAERWTFAENWNFEDDGCELISGDYVEVADANTDWF